MSPDAGIAMDSAAVTARLERLSRLVVLDPARRLSTKVDFSPAAVTRRLRLQSALGDACRAWGRAAPSRS